MAGEDYKASHPEDHGEPTPAYEGFSGYTEESSAASFHSAVQEAARAAARAAADAGKTEPEWFEVTRVQVLVGNPNVKMYRVVITPTY